MNIRLAQQKDAAQLIEVLAELSDTSECNIPAVSAVIYYSNLISSSPKKIYVLEENGEILGTGSLLFDYKIIRGCGVVGMIEDIAIKNERQGEGFGKIIVNFLSNLALATIGCYKVILSCSGENIPFYKKCGFYESSYTMRKDNE